MDISHIVYGLVEEIYHCNNTHRISYGIVVYTDVEEDGMASMIASFRDLSSDKASVLDLVDRCNRQSLSPLHLADVVEDFLS